MAVGRLLIFLAAENEKPAESDFSGFFVGCDLGRGGLRADQVLVD
jgi:hypothetical protein